MDINKHIVDQRIRKIVADNPDKFEAISNDNNKKLSKAFVCLAVSAYLDVEIEEAFDYMTDGGQDAGIDAICIGDVGDWDFSVTVFQGKYTFDLDKDSNFPANSIQRVIGTIAAIFDPNKPVEMNDDLKSKVTEIRSLIADGYIPTIKCVFTNNGLKWNQDGENHIANAGFPKEQVWFDHFNQRDIVNSIQSRKGISETVKLSGKSIQEDFNFKRVLIGKINVVELAKLFDRHGENLLEQNIRKYLGINRNRVNEAIKSTLLNEKRDNFYFYNNGITMTCSKFSYNALQADDWSVKIENLQVINGGQTCKTILHTVRENSGIDYSQAYVLIRLYELSGDETDTLITDITIATNSQNPVDLRDLRANDEMQRRLETDIAGLGYIYKRKKDTSPYQQEKTILSSVAAESIYAIWRSKPHQAKFKRNDLFGAFYQEIFSNINGSQLVIAVLIFRYSDLQRKKGELINDYPHIPYSNYFMAMIMGKMLLGDLEIPFDKLSHRNFEQTKEYFETNKEELYIRANNEIVRVLGELYPEGYDMIDLRRLAATFRRGDLMMYL
jgi:hypothetical protein